MEQIKNGLSAVIKELFGVEVDVELTRPAEQFGDYATNVAMQLAGRLGQNPREIAEAIAAKLPTNIVAKAEVAGPGFINLWLTDEQVIHGIYAEIPRPLEDKRLLVEYSDPNPFKPLHAGHLYTTIVGDVIARLIEHAGAETIRLNYGGDVGRHVGISMWAIIRYLGGEFPEKLSEIPEAERPAWMGVRYVEGTTAFEEDDQAKVEIIAANKRVYELQASGDQETPFARIYWTCRQWSYDYFQTLYQQLQVAPFQRYIPESEVTQLGIDTVREELQRDVFEQSDGAVIFDGEKHGLHKRVFINSEGLPTYEAKDVGLSLTKWRDYQPDTSVIITANEQAQYMQVVLKALEQFAPEAAKATVHLTHGVVKLSGGVKMSSRKGNVVTALEIIEAARVAGQATGTNPDENTILAAVKYAFLKNRIGGDIIYEPAESIALEGNSGPYLQYAHARARSILRKAGKASEGISGDLQPDERSLARSLSMYQETVLAATDELMPHVICTYLYELAQSFNRFYEKNRVIGDEREALRLGLVAAYADVLKHGLELLGIFAPEKM